MPNREKCPKCGHCPVRFGQITIDKETRTTFFCDNCEYRWSSINYPIAEPDTPAKRIRPTK